MAFCFVGMPVVVVAVVVVVDVIVIHGELRQHLYILIST